MWFCSYALKPRRALSALAGARTRHGALIRTESGFADVHPWPELGDAPLDEQLRLLARGADNQLIARALVISPQTARTHVQNILVKLRVHSRLEAVAFARRMAARAAANGQGGRGNSVA